MPPTLDTTRWLVPVVLTVALTACGGSDSGGDGAGEPSATPQRQGQAPSGDQREQLQELFACLREQGLDIPEPDSGQTPGQGGPPPGLDPSDPDFQRATEACQQYRPESPGAGGQTPEDNQ